MEPSNSSILFVSGSGTAQIFIDGPSSSINGPYPISGIEVDFTGTASNVICAGAKGRGFSHFEDARSARASQNQTAYLAAKCR
jgi:hypothetical protein